MNHVHCQVADGCRCRYTAALFRKLPTRSKTWGRDNAVEQAMCRQCANSVDRTRQKSESRNPELLLKKETSKSERPWPKYDTW